MSFLWYVADDGSELCDFELGLECSEWDREAEEKEIRHTLSYMVRERACLVSKLRGMYALREYLSADHYQKADNKCKCDQAIVASRQEAGAIGTCVYNVDVYGKERHRNISTVEAESRNTTHATESKNLNGVSCPELESIDLITQLRLSNQELQQHIVVLQEVVYLSQVDGCSQTGGCNSCRILKAKLVRYIARVRKLEHAAKARQVLCSSLIEHLHVMTRKVKCNLGTATSQATGMSEKQDDAIRKVESSQQPEAALRLNGGSGIGSPEKYSKEKPNDHQTSDSPDSAYSGRSEANSEGNSVPTNSSSVLVKHELRRGPPGLCEEPVLKKRVEDAEKELKEVNDKLNKTAGEKSKLEEEIEDMKSQHFKEVTMLRIQINKLEQVNKQYQDMITQLQGKEHSIKRDMEQMLLQARDMVDRERQEKFASVAEQKSLRQQVENLSTTMKSLQVKNDDMIRFHCDQDEEVDDYRRLKKLIQENGLPTVDQLIALRRQNETYREDFMNERKEKERLSSLKDKLKRDLDNTQSRISSLQEQVYKYREHIYFLQQKSKQDTRGPPSSPLFEQTIPSVVPSSPLAVASKLYGSSAPQYINETLLQGQGQGSMPFDGKKASAGKHGEGPMGKPWQQFQQPQGIAGRFGRQMPTEDWKRGYPPGHSGAHPWDVFSPPQSRLSSASSLSSPRSGSSSSEDVSEGTGQDKGHFGGGPRERGQFGAGQPERQQYLRRQGPRPTLTERVSDPDGRQMQQYGPPSSPFEAWSKSNFQHSRVQRHYSTPCGNGLRSPTPDHWSSGQNVAGFQRPWQAFPEHSAFHETTISTPSGLRPTAEPWPPVTSNGQSNNNGEENPSTRMAGVSSIR